MDPITHTVMALLWSAICAISGYYIGTRTGAERALAFIYHLEDDKE